MSNTINITDEYKKYTSTNINNIKLFNLHKRAPLITNSANKIKYLTDSKHKSNKKMLFYYKTSQHTVKQHFKC